MVRARSTGSYEATDSVSPKRVSVDGDPYCDGLFSSPDTDIFVATVIATEAGTNANPPHVVLRVERTINGNPPKGDVRATWQPPTSFLCGVEDEASFARWTETPLRGPTSGERLLLAGWQDAAEAEYAVDGACVRAATAANIAQTQKSLARMRAFLASTARAEKAAFEADRRVQAGADLEALYRSADVVLVGTEPSVAVGLGGSMLKFRVLRRFKDSGPEGRSNAKFAHVRISKTDQTQFRLRFSGIGATRLVLFLRTVPKTEWRGWSDPGPDGQSEVVDHRRFVPVENTESVLRETKDIVQFLESQSK